MIVVFALTTYIGYAHSLYTPKIRAFDFPHPIKVGEIPLFFGIYHFLITWARSLISQKGVIPGNFEHCLLSAAVRRCRMSGPARGLTSHAGENSSC